MKSDAWLSDALWELREKRRLEKGIPWIVRTAPVPRFRMPIPQTREALVALGWRFTNTSSCKACGEAIEWWITSNERPMPMRVIEKDGGEVLQSHFVDCQYADQFRKKKERRHGTP